MQETHLNISVVVTMIGVQNILRYLPFGKTILQNIKLQKIQTSHHCFVCNKLQMSHHWANHLTKYIYQVPSAKNFKKYKQVITVSFAINFK